MFFLILAVICSVLIGNLLVVFKNDPASDIKYIFLGNYIVASLFSLALALPHGLYIGGFDIWFGVLTGLFFLSNLVIYQRNIAVNGLSLSVGVMRVAVILPTLMSFIYFAERLGMVNLIGIVVIFAAFSVLTEIRLLHNLLWLIGLFLISGLTESTLKIYSELGNSNQQPFLMMIFASAGVFTLFWIMIGKNILNWKSLLYGFALGVPNQLSSLFFLKGLKTIPATVAYPIYASGVVLVSIISDLLIWRKFFTIKQRIALGLLVSGVILVSLNFSK